MTSGLSRTSSSAYSGTIASPVGIAKLDVDVFTIRVAEGVQTAPECIGKRMRRRRGHQHSNKGEFSFSLCARPKRPRRSHSAEQRNELPSPHGHSLHARITHLTTFVPRGDLSRCSKMPATR